MSCFVAYGESLEHLLKHRVKEYHKQRSSEGQEVVKHEPAELDVGVRISVW